MTKYFLPVREPFNAYSHLIGAVISIFWTLILLFKSVDSSIWHKSTFLIYGLTVFFMFSSSAIYHSVNVSFKREEFFRLIDHIMIYVVIAGSYTPMCAIILEGEWRLWMLIGVWSFALFGILKKIFWLNAPRWFSTLLYLLMGWLAVLIFPQIWDLLPHGFAYWIAVGGLSYTFGAIIYIFEKPNPVPDSFGFHEIWHIFVMVGAFSHFWAIYYYLPNFYPS